MTYELALYHVELMVIDEEPLDLLSRTIEAKVQKLDEEATSIKKYIEWMDNQMAMALHSCSYEFPAMAARIRHQINRLAELKGQPLVPDNVDPISHKDPDGEDDPSIKAALKEAVAQEKADIEEMLKTSAGQKLKAECRKLFQWLSPRVHPDKSKDRSLHHLFDVARKAQKDNDLDLLRNLKSQVHTYLRIKSKNKSFQAFMDKALKQNQAKVHSLLEQKAMLKQTVQWECFETLSGPKYLRQRAYANFCEIAERNIKRKCDMLEAEALGTMRRERDSEPFFNP